MLKYTFPLKIRLSYQICPQHKDEIDMFLKFQGRNYKFLKFEGKKIEFQSNFWPMCVSEIKLHHGVTLA